MTRSVSHRRTDTRRNHDRILTVAAEAVVSGELSFNAIAKRAGVGVGTVYRHFPTREALVLAVYEREVRHLLEVVPDLLAAHPPEQAFRTWATGHLARYMMTKRGLAGALQSAGASADGVAANAFRGMVEATTALVEANVRAGTVRADVEPETVLRGLGGLLYLDPNDDWQQHAEDLVDLIWRGMATPDGPLNRSTH
ncbi:MULTISPECIES: TetR/AcrR family transcriptional regulator [Pseudonocardia]|uniref:Bacterial regulatory protein n=2 Tax=Pseudonocardia TaxID=1847 RepID=A0A1Y2MP27_PSEAH|nr:MULTISPECIES: TetR/AcrR family transcriptional regulator [Pseudonocardia]OSY36437.1 Bacterial regulatory protein [Pseudonocardia autotrophica]TDN74729.1 TetR family transcriptional regulator [Pseudonocardia autotrophica]BBG05504.1 TetR family transcriptional regulator [Pseudonocardia autotrophica]GEC28029.1 TetR family transcriptional regulator [Pseudonocardia saturnea]